MSVFSFERSDAKGVAQWEEGADGMPPKPFVDGNSTFIGGEVKPWAGEATEVTSPILDAATGKRAVIGSLANMDEAAAMEAAIAAATAWDKGQGAWPQMAPAARIAALEAVLAALLEARAEIVNILMWEICKTAGDAAKEFDRTIDYARASIASFKEEDAKGSGWTTVSGVAARVRRGPVGAILFLAPFNYPLNEMYAMLVPALLMGNTVTMKLPTIGGQCHVLTAAAFAAHVPPGVLNFVSGSGRKTCPPIMRSGVVDMLGFIGGSKACDALIGEHPAVHRLRVFSQLEGKNFGVVLADADLDVAAKQCALGATSYNGQRCTAIKLMLVHRSVHDAFVAKLLEHVGALAAGLPWAPGVAITPLPEPSKPTYLEELVADALAGGATIANAGAGGGGVLRGALLAPPVVVGVTPSMRLFHEEQFGPVLPVAAFDDVAEVHAAVRASWNGQQAALFTRDPAAAAPLIDMLSTVVGRINLNVQCSRGPDVFPFSGRRSSAMGTMSVTEALRGFSIEVVLAYPAASEDSKAVAEGAEAASSFLSVVG